MIQTIHKVTSSRFGHTELGCTVMPADRSTGTTTSTAIQNTLKMIVGEANYARLKQKPVKLDAKRRSSIEKAVIETCEKRGWKLLALSIRTNHVHIVVVIGLRKPSIALNAFKANATRIMRENSCWTSDRSPWADKGSERWLWTEKHVYDAVQYVLNGQGVDLPKFD